MTREDQVRAAEKIASLNPDWTLADAGGQIHFFPKGRLSTAVLRVGLVTWEAFDWVDGFLTGPRGGIRRFRSLPAAVRAIGYTVKET